MEEKIETTKLTEPFFISFFIVFISTLIVYKIFGFETGIFYCMSLSVAFISMGLVGLENVIITKK